jgi:hypothetical protein
MLDCHWLLAFSSPAWPPARARPHRSQVQSPNLLRRSSLLESSAKCIGGVTGIITITVGGGMGIATAGDPNYQIEGAVPRGTAPFFCVERAYRIEQA